MARTRMGEPRRGGWVGGCEGVWGGLWGVEGGGRVGGGGGGGGWVRGGVWGVGVLGGGGRVVGGGRLRARSLPSFRVCTIGLGRCKPSMLLSNALIVGQDEYLVRCLF